MAEVSKRWDQVYVSELVLEGRRHLIAKLPNIYRGREERINSGGLRQMREFVRMCLIFLGK